MNRTFRIVFNRSAGVWQVASEHARGRGKGGARPLLLVAALAVAAGLLAGESRAAWIRFGDVFPNDPLAWNDPAVALIVGNTRAGTLSITDGSGMENAQGVIGNAPGSFGMVTVQDPGSNWLLHGGLSIGAGGAGTLSLVNGGYVEVGGGTGTVMLAPVAGGMGTINIGGLLGFAAETGGALLANEIRFGGGDATLNFNHTETLHPFSAGLKSTGSGVHRLNQIAGTTVLTGANGGFNGKTTVSGGKLLVLGSLGGSAEVTGGTLQYGDGVSGAASRLSGDLKVSGAGSTLSVQGPATLAVGGDIGLGDGAVLDVMAGAGGPVLWADSVTLGQGVAFKLSGIADESQLNALLIDTASGISGDFATVNVGGFSGPVDYLTVNTGKSADNRQYRATYDLSWTAGNNLAHGTFTLENAQDFFAQGLGLSDQAPNPAKGWNGRTLTKAGEGTLTLDGNNSYTGGTVLAGGMLQVSRDANLGDANGKVVFDGGALRALESFTSSRAITLLQTGSVDVEQSRTLDLTGEISGGGDLVKTGRGMLSLSNPGNTYGNTWIKSGALLGNASSIRGNVDNGGILVFEQVADGVFGGSITGFGTMVKTGAGTLSLTGNHAAYAGSTVASEGRLLVLGALGGSAVVNGGVLQFGNGASGAASKLTGNLPVYSGSLSVQGPATLTVDGDIGMADRTTLDIGAGAGGPAITAGSVTLGADVALAINGIDGAGPAEQVLIETRSGISGDFGRVSVGGNGGGVDYLGVNAGKSEDGRRYLASYGLRWMANNSLAHGTFTLSGAADRFEVNAALADQAANAALGWNGRTLTKRGAGTLVLSGDNRYTGGTVLDGGTVQVDRDANLGAPMGGLTFNGGTLAATGSFDTSRAVLMDTGGSIDVAAGSTLGLDGPLLGAGPFFKNGAGTLALRGVNSYAGLLVLTGGTLRIDQDANLGTGAGSLLLGGGALATTSTFDISRRVVLDATAMAGFDVAGGTTLGLNGQISGAGMLVKAGAGTLALRGDNYYGGGTTILDGVLQVDHDRNLGYPSGALKLDGGALAATGRFDTSRAVTLAQAGRFDVAAGVTLGLGGIVSGSGDLIKSGAGTLRLSHTGNAYGNTSILAGTLAGNANSISGNVDNAGTLEFEQSPSAIFGGAISGAGRVVKSGWGTLELTGTNTFGGGMTVTDGTLRVTRDANLGAAAGGLTLDRGTLATAGAFDTSRTVRLEQFGIIDVQGGTTLGLNGRVSGNGVLLKQGGGTLALSGANDYGGTYIDNGVLRIGRDANLGSGELVFFGGALATTATFDMSRAVILMQTAGIDVAADTALGLNGTVSYEGGLVKNGAGTLVLAGSNSYEGGTTLAGGTLQVARDANLGDAIGGLSFDGGTLATTGTFDTARGVTLAQAGRFDVAAATALGLNGTVSGSGAFIKDGAGTLVLAGSNTYGGGTRIEGGVLQVSRDTNLGDAAGGLSFNDGTLATTGTFSTLRAVALAQSGRFDVATGTTLGLNGAVSGTGAFVKDGAGTLALAGGNTYGGGTRIDGGVLRIERDANLGDIAGGVAFGGGTLATTGSFDTWRTFTLAQAGRFDVAAGTSLGLTGGITGSGDLVKTGAGTLRLGNAGNAYGNTWIQSGTLIGDANSISGNVDNAGALVFEQSADGVFNGSISGTGDLFKRGAGTLDLSGNHAGFAGKTTVSEGRLVVQRVLGGLAEVAGGVLQYGNGVAGAANRLAGNLKVAGGGLSVQGPATLDVAGEVAMGDGTALDIGVGAAAPSLTAGSVTLGAGVAFNLSGISDASQLDQVLIDTLGGINGDFASVSVGGFAGAVDYLSVNTRKATGGLQYVASYGLSWTSGNNLAHGNFTLAGAAEHFTIGAALADQAANAATGWDGKTLTKHGAGTLVLSGENRYTGGTHIAGGTLQIDRDANLGAAAGGLSFSGGTLATTASFDTARAITLVQAGRFDVAAGTALGLDGTVAGSGALVKQGAGTLVLRGSNRHGGGTAIEQGTLQIGRDANLGAAGAGLTFNGGTLATTGTFDIARGVTLAQAGRFDVAAATTLGLNGTVSGTGAFVKDGAGTLVLAGSNSYGGGTRIEGGILQVARDANLGDAAGGLSFNGGTLATTGTFSTLRAVALAQSGRFDVATGTTLGLNGAVSGTGAFVKDGAGTLALAGGNTYGGGTRIDGGVLRIERDANLGDIAGGVAFGGGTLATTGSFDTWRTFTLAQAGRFDVAAGTSLGLTGGITGSGDLVKTGAGTLRLGNAGNAYGNTWIQSGTLIGDANSISGNVDNAGALVFEQSADGVFNGSISGTGDLFKRGAGTLDLSGNHAGFAGKTTVSEGRLVVQRVLGGLAEVAGGVLQYGNGVAGAANRLAGNLKVAGGGLSVQGPATLDVAGEVAMGDGTALDIGVGAAAPSLTAGSVTLGAGVAFNLSGISDASQLDQVLIDTLGGIRGDFASVSVGGFAGAVDYLSVKTRKSADGRQYRASHSLAWSAGNNLAHGTFTLANAGDRFVVATALADQAPNAATGWNGKTLTKAGAGTLVLSGENRYTGGTNIAGGALQIDRDANLGAAAGALTFSGGTLATMGSFDIARSITLAQAGRFEVAGGTELGLTGAVAGAGDLVKSGAGILRLDNAGNAYRNTHILAGTLVGNAATIRGDIDNAGTLVFEQAADASYGGAMSGTGSFVKNGAGTLGLTGDSSGYRGTTTVNGGRLAMQGRLGGSISIGAGGVLGGNGTIGSGAGSTITVAAGGVLSPGNSIGALTIDGDLAVQRGARFAVETNPAGPEADLVHVTGNAALDGGSVAHIGANGNYGLRSRYTILSADGALSGQFDAVTSDFAFLTPSLAYDYDARRVSLELARNDTPMISAAATRNQRAAAGAIDSIGMAGGHRVYDAVAQLPDDAPLLRGAFDQLSGEIHASARTVLLQDSRYVRDAVAERLRAAAGGVGAVSAPVLASAGDGARLAPADARGPATWLQATGSWSHIDGDGNAARAKSSSGGFVMGVDTPVSEAWRLGLMAGYSRTDFDVQQRSSSGDSDNYHLGAYGGGQWGKLGLRGGLAYSWHDITTRRSVSMSGMSERLEADYDGRTAQVYADLSYRIDTPAAAIEPFANAAYVNLKTDGYRESGGAAALRGKSQTNETTYTTLGARASTDFELGGAQAAARGSLGWRHAFGDVKPVAVQAFSAGESFTVAGVPIAKNSAVVEAGLEVRINRRASFGLSYQGQLAGSAQDHGVRAGLNIRF